MRVLISRQASDYRFVAWALSKYKLTGRVVAPPDEVSETPGSRRIVERYDWGRVVFSYRVIGGSCSTMVVIFERARACDVSDCFGSAAGPLEHDSSQCHGGRGQQACPMKDRCEAVKRCAARLGVAVDALLMACSVEETCSGKASALMVEKAKATTRVNQRERSKTKTTRPSVHVSMMQARAQLTAFAQVFFEGVAKEGGCQLARGDTAATRGKLKEGQLYFRNRVERSSYLGLYVNHAAGWDDPVCVLRLLPRYMHYSVRLPLTEKQLRKLDAEGVCAGYELSLLSKKHRLRAIDGGHLRAGVAVEHFEAEKLPNLTGLVTKLLKRGS